MCNRSAAICNRMSSTLKSTGGWVILGPNLGVFPSEQTRHVGVAKSARPSLTNGEIIFEEFQPMWSQFTNVTDGQTDRQTTCDRNTALCTKVHRAVITTACRDNNHWHNRCWTLLTHAVSAHARVRQGDGIDGKTGTTPSVMVLDKVAFCPPFYLEFILMSCRHSCSRMSTE